MNRTTPSTQSELAECARLGALSATFVFFLLLFLGCMLSATARAQDARATANPCKEYVGEPRNRRHLPQLIYNGVDKLIAPMDKPIKLPPEFIGERMAACVLIEVVVREKDGQLLIEKELQRGVYPPRRTDLMGPIQQAGIAVLRQVPLAKVLPRKPIPGVPQIIAVPLWPGHGFYGNDSSQVIGTDLREMGYSDAERIVEKDGVFIYKVYEERTRVIYVALRTLGDNEPIAEYEKLPHVPGQFENIKYKGAVADIHRLIEPTLSSWSGLTVIAEVRHYARNLRLKHEFKNTEVSLSLVNDPKTRQYADHPLYVSTHIGRRRGANSLLVWTDDLHSEHRYKTVWRAKRAWTRSNSRCGKAWMATIRWQAWAIRIRRSCSSRLAPVTTFPRPMPIALSWSPCMKSERPTAYSK